VKTDPDARSETAVLDGTGGAIGDFARATAIR